MQRRSQHLLLIVVSLTLLLQGCAFKKKAQCTALVKNVNTVNAAWKKLASLKPPANKSPKTQQEFNALAIDTTKPLIDILQEVDPLISQIQGEEIDDKLLAVYQQNLTFLHVKRSNILRKGVNSIRTLAPGADIAEMAMRSGGSMSESLPSTEASGSSSRSRPFGAGYNGQVSVAGTMFEGQTDQIKRLQRENKARMAQMSQALSFLREMEQLDEEIKPQELSIMRRVSATCDIPMPKT